MLLDDKKVELYVKRSSRDGRTGDIVSVVQLVGADVVVSMNIKKMGYFPMDELEFHKMMTGEILRDKVVEPEVSSETSPSGGDDSTPKEEASEKEKKTTTTKKVATKRVRKVKKAE
jgi:hypothetical protein